MQAANGASSYISEAAARYVDAREAPGAPNMCCKSTDFMHMRGTQVQQIAPPPHDCPALPRPENSLTGFGCWVGGQQVDLFACDASGSVLQVQTHPLTRLVGVAQLIGDTAKK